MMTKRECQALAEIAWTGLIARNFIADTTYSTEKFNKALSFAMGESRDFMVSFRLYGILIMSINLFENDRKTGVNRLAKMDLPQAVENILEHASAYSMDILPEYDMFFSFRRLAKKEDDRMAKRGQVYEKF